MLRGNSSEGQLLYCIRPTCTPSGEMLRSCTTSFRKSSSLRKLSLPIVDEESSRNTRSAFCRHPGQSRRNRTHVKSYGQCIKILCRHTVKSRLDKTNIKVLRTVRQEVLQLVYIALVDIGCRNQMNTKSASCGHYMTKNKKARCTVHWKVLRDIKQ